MSRFPSSRARLALAAIATAAVVVPLVSVPLCPLTDLPQHVAQIRQLLEALTRPDGPYRIQWLVPHALGALPLLAGWALAGPTGAARVGLGLLALSWVGAVHFVASRRRRSAAAALLASSLLFSHVLAWGFLPFAFGWPVFLVWLHLAAPSADRPDHVPIVRLGALALLVYSTHVLWLLVATGWVLASLVLRAAPTRHLIRVGASLGPALALAAIWWLGFADSTARTPAEWYTLGERLSPEWWIEGTLGLLRGPAEPALCLLLATWAGLGLLRPAPGYATDRHLLRAALLLLLLALLLPDKLMNTIQFGTRYLPSASVLLLLSLPPPRMPPPVRRLVAIATLVLFSGLVTVAWHRVDRHELAGLQESLERLPPGGRVLGLDFLRESAWIDGEPFFQQVAWAQVLAGSEIGFSFAEHPTSLVVYREPRNPPWTPKLEWRPNRVRREDLVWFDHLLVAAPAARHRAMSRDPLLEPLTDHAVWRLYRIHAAPPAHTGDMPGSSPATGPSALR